MPVLSHVHPSSMPNSAKSTSTRSGGKTIRCHVLAIRATTLDAEARTNTAPDATLLVS